MATRYADTSQRCSTAVRTRAWLRQLRAQRRMPRPAPVHKALEVEVLQCQQYLACIEAYRILPEPLAAVQEGTETQHVGSPHITGQTRQSQRQPHEFQHIVDYR